jgi:hypothetical protein
MKPVIFLDFDGVLNGNDWLMTLPLTFSSVVDLDPACCARLQRILDATGAGPSPALDSDTSVQKHMGRNTRYGSLERLGFGLRRGCTYERPLR